MVDHLTFKKNPECCANCHFYVHDRTPAFSLEEEPPGNYCNHPGRAKACDVYTKEIEKLLEAGTGFMAKQQIENLMVTLSDKGMLIIGSEGYHHIEANKRTITDVSGAGDTVISISALCYASGLNNLQTGLLANLAGGQVCEKSGVVPIDRDQLLEESQQYVSGK